MHMVRTNHYEIIEEEQFLNRKIQISTVLEIFKRKRYKNTEEFMCEIKNTIKPAKLKDQSLSSKSEKKAYPILENYLSYFLKQGYAPSSLHNQVKSLKLFLSFLSEHYSEISPFRTENDMKQLNKFMIIAYEKSLEERIYLGEVQKCTVNIYLNALKMFTKMLSDKCIINFVYLVPDRLKAHGKRSNEYVEVEEIKALIDILVNSSNKMRFRDLSIVLLVMETGCRPIEIKNLKIPDFKPTDREIHLYSIKSGNRTLKLSKDLCDLLMEHLEIRLTYKTNNDFLFVNSFGEQLNDPKAVFSQVNSKNANRQNITAKALRHTYATNALDNGNDFDEVSDSMGHKHRCSTQYYIYKSIKRLLNNTLPHNPLSQFSTEG